MESRRVVDKARPVKGRVSFDLAAGASSPTKSYLVDPLDIDGLNRDRDFAQEPPFTDETARAGKSAEADDLFPSPSSSGSLGDEAPSSLESDSGYVIVGKQRRRMSNAMEALDLDLQPKRRPSCGQDRKNQLNGTSVASSSSSNGPRFSLGQLSYMWHSPLNSETGSAMVNGIADGKGHLELRFRRRF